MSHEQLQEEKVLIENPVQNQIDNQAEKNEDSSRLEEERRLEEKRIFDNIKSHQNFPFAVIGGLLAALLSAVLWAVITVLTKYQIGYMAILVGLIVGMTVRYFGAGIDKKFGILGAVLSLLGCALGNLFSQIGFIAHEYSYSYLEVISLLNLTVIIDVMTESFSPMDILFYGIAVYEGYRFSFRQITPEVMKKEGSSEFFRFRMPLAVMAALLLAGAYFMLIKGYSGPKSYTYENGQLMSEGQLTNGKYDGAWTFYYENGNILSKGSFDKDLRDGDWMWYTENGSLEKTGSYEKGLSSGVWINYHENGTLLDSACYASGRLNGKYISRYENGSIYETGGYKLDKQDGVWQTFYENGRLQSEGEMKDGLPAGDWTFYYDNGRLREEVSYDDSGSMLIKNSWDADGNQFIKDGSGCYAIYSEENVLLSEGTVRDGKRTGSWKTYYPDGKLKEEGIYENDIYKIMNAWNNKGEQTFTGGNGKYTSYWDDNSVQTTGEIAEGLKEGRWLTYNTSGEVISEINYLHGDMHGPIKSYYYSDQLSMEGGYSHGLKHGKWTWYNGDGSISSSAQFKDDKKEGVQTFCDEHGSPLKKETYKNGELINVEVLN